MRKYLLTALVVSCISTLPVRANADHRLLVTDVLGAKEVELGAALQYAYTSQDRTFRVLVPHIDGITTFAALPGKTTANVLISSYYLGLGLGNGFQVNAGVPYAFREDYKNELLDGTDRFAYGHKEGWGDFDFGGKYGLLGDARKSFAVVTGLDIKFDTASEANFGTGTTDVSPYIAVSDVVGSNSRPYAEYRAIISNHGHSDSHTINIGNEYSVNDSLTLRPSVSVAFRTASQTLEAYESFNLRLFTYVQLFRDLYLLPSATVGTSTATRERHGIVSYRPSTFYGFGVGAYYLFD